MTLSAIGPIDTPEPRRRASDRTACLVLTEDRLAVQEPRRELREVIAFGAFQLIAAEQLLLECGRPVKLGGRAIDLLTALIGSAGSVLTKEELRAHVWPNTVVEDSSLRVHIAALRRALGDGEAGSRYIANIPGRGYAFVAEVERLQWAGAETPQAPSTALPVRLTRPRGLQLTRRTLQQMLEEHRLVTLIGPGGVGKTTAALDTAECLREGQACEVRFIDLSTIREPGALHAAVGVSMGLGGARPGGAVAMAAHGLRDRPLLLILDNCEHLVEAAARSAVTWLRAVPGLRILATSREPLRAESEALFNVAPLAVPPGDRLITDTAQALQYEAVQLLVERVAAVLPGFQLADGEAEVAAELCRRLDGLPLALELAAGRARLFGLRGLLGPLADGLQLLACGQRTVEPRHRSLVRSLDWSFDLLGPEEQRALHRLGAFDGAFSLSDAWSMLGEDGLSAEGAVTVVAELANKSLLVADIGDAPSYRLLSTTRAYLRGRSGSFRA